MPINYATTGAELPFEAAVGAGSIPEFFAGRSVLLTGGTGFVGKVTVEKLLRTCPEIDTIYLLVRARKSQAPSDRVTALMQQSVFGEAKRLQPGCEAKVKAINGDISVPGLGISDDDRAEICKRVSVIFHIAATVKFTEKLRVATSMNIAATQGVLVLAKQLDHCACMVHTSTAYCHTHRPFCKEVFYPPTFPPEKLLALLESIDDDSIIDAITPTLIKPHPNTYTFTKCLGEHLVKTMCEDTLPCAMVRPAIVSAAWSEPYAGWSDTTNGPGGIALATGSGLCTILPINGNAEPAIVPVDTVASYLVAAAWHTATAPTEAGKPGLNVYNCVGSENPTSWEAFNHNVNTSWERFPLQRAMRSSGAQMFSPTSNVGYAAFKIWSTLCDYLPLRAADYAATAMGRRPFASRAHGKLSNLLFEYTPWLNNSWRWSIANQSVLTKAMRKEDRATFNISIEGMEWSTYVTNLVLGLKTYIAKEEGAADRAKSNQARLMWTANFVRILVAALTWRLALWAGAIRRNLSLPTTLVSIMGLAQAYRAIYTLSWNVLRQPSFAPLPAEPVAAAVQVKV